MLAVEEQVTPTEVSFPEKLRVLFEAHRYKVVYGPVVVDQVFLRWDP